jgi:rhodanese-related sulfurtransferase
MEQLLKDFDLEFCANGKYKITPEKFFKLDKAFFLDVRTKEEFLSFSFNLKHHKNIKSKNIPINEIPNRIDEITTKETVAIFCPGSIRASFVYAYLYSKGFKNIKILTGGYTALTEELTSAKIIKTIKD